MLIIKETLMFYVVAWATTIATQIHYHTNHWCHRPSSTTHPRKWCLYLVFNLALCPTFPISIHDQSPKFFQLRPSMTHPPSSSTQIPRQLTHLMKVSHERSSTLYFFCFFIYVKSPLSPPSPNLYFLPTSTINLNNYLWVTIESRTMIAPPPLITCSFLIPPRSHRRLYPYFTFSQNSCSSITPTLPRITSILECLIAPSIQTTVVHHCPCPAIRHPHLPKFSTSLLNVLWLFFMEWIQSQRRDGGDLWEREENRILGRWDRYVIFAI